MAAHPLIPTHDAMHDAIDTADFATKWTTRWPEWTIARTFVPAAEHADAEAWFALLQEWGEAAWAGEVKALTHGTGERTFERAIARLLSGGAPRLAVA